MMFRFYPISTPSLWRTVCWALVVGSLAATAGAAPSADITDVSPDPRTTAVASVEIVFDEEVQNFDVSDLTLTLDAGPNLLTGTETLSTTDNIVWSLDLTGLTSWIGTYEITVLVSDIQNLIAEPLLAPATDTWVRVVPVEGQNGYTVETYHLSSLPGTEPMISFDWDGSGALYYSTGDAFFGLRLKVFKYDGATTQVFPETPIWAGSRVTRIRDFIYFNEAGDFARFDDFNYYRYDPATGGPCVNLGNGSTLNCWGLNTRYGDEVFVSAGGPTWSAGIYYTMTDVNGDFVSDPWVNLGQIGESAGPIAFDADGNMYYAHGWVPAPPARVFRFSSAEVDAAIIDPVGSPLTPTGHEWAELPGFDGATGMACDASGNLVLTVSSFVLPTELRLYHVNCDGSNDGYTTLATHPGRLETVRVRNSKAYVSCAEGIFDVPLPTLLVTATDPGPGMVAMGTAVTFSVTVTGQAGPLSYQWYQVDGPMPGTPVGTNSDTFSFTASPADDGDMFYCEVTDTVDTVKSCKFMLIVQQPVPAASGAGLMVLVALISSVLAWCIPKHAARRNS